MSEPTQHSDAFRQPARADQALASRVQCIEEQMLFALQDIDQLGQQVQRLQQQVRALSERLATQQIVSNHAGLKPPQPSDSQE